MSGLKAARGGGERRAREEKIVLLKEPCAPRERGRTGTGVRRTNAP